jgi:uncharacterized repeat protein (TIGR03803 family)
MSKFTWVTKACGVFLLWAAAAVSLPAQTFTTLFSFDVTDGYAPVAALVQGTDGNFYGTTLYGGTVNDDAGTVFKITPSGTLTTLYSFCSLSECADGEEPYAGLIQGTDGNLYGTTNQGGLDGGGTIFKITPDGTLTTLYKFCTQNVGGHCTDGYAPRAGLVQGTDGNFYGTAGEMGAGDAGTLFKVTPPGTLTVLYNFCSQTNCTDGAEPEATLIQGSDGELYGTTVSGGVNDDGTVFRITTSGTLTTLHSFDGTDGENPAAALVQAKNGDLYGTTIYGGASSTCNDGCGVTFKITPGGTFTTLLSFDDADGAYPDGALIQATDGNLYGAVTGGGTYGDGTIVKITLHGTLTTLYDFDGSHGSIADAGLVQETNGTFYGTTAGGGGNCDCSEGCGTVYSLNVGLGQFVETNPTSGKVGAAVKILGSFLTGATSVTFNGTPATFSVNSKSEITTTVPTGAITGAVQVVTPRLGTLSSNVPFTVRP